MLRRGFPARAPPDPKRVFADALASGDAMVSEPFSEKFHVKAGDTVELPGPGGPVRVRVAGVYDLAAWLLQVTPVNATPAPASADPLLASAAATIGATSGGASGGVWTGQMIQQRIAAGAREDIKLPKPVPVIWVYMTGWASADGTVHFRDDVYNVDSVGG